MLTLYVTSSANNVCKHFGLISVPEVITLFSCSTQLSTKFQLLIKTIIPTYEEISRFKYLIYVPFIMLINVKMPRHFEIYEHDKFHAQLS